MFSRSLGDWLLHLLKMEGDEEDDDEPEALVPRIKLPMSNFCLSVMRPEMTEVTGCENAAAELAAALEAGEDDGERVSLNNRILLSIVHGMTYGTAGAPKTAAAIAVTCR